MTTELIKPMSPTYGARAEPPVKGSVSLQFPFGNDNELTITMRKQVSQKQFDTTVKAVYDLSVAAFVDNRLSDEAESTLVDDLDE